MPIQPRWGNALALLAAALTGYQLGGLRMTAASAPKDQSKILLETDRELDQATARSGEQGWLLYCADDAVLLPAGAGMVIGKEAIQKYLEPRFAAPGFSMRWEPIEAYVSGDLGYTQGISRTSRNGLDGKPIVGYGKYVTIWRKQRDGSWKLALDIGNSNPPPEAKPSPALPQ
jgi:ketosteroid isomerase-like protein